VAPLHLAREEGQGLVEFALIVPFLLVLILGLVDLGRALGYKNDETNLANQAARLAVVSSGTTCTACGPSTTISDYIIGTAPTELKDGTGAISKRTEAGFTTKGLYVTFTFPNMTNGACSSAPAGTACGYCKGDPVRVDITAKYNFLSFLLGKGALPANHDIASSATMRMESSYDVNALNPPNGFTPQGWSSGKPACTA